MGATRQWIAGAMLASLAAAGWAAPEGEPDAALILKPAPSLGSASGDAAKPANEAKDSKDSKDSKDAEAAKAPLAIDPPEATLDEASFGQSDAGKRLGAIAWATLQEGPKAEWPAGKVPKIPQARMVRQGEKVSLLVFVATRADIALDAPAGIQYAVDIYKPDGTLDKRFGNNPCLPKDAKMEGGTLAVCAGLVTFEVEESDPRGRWVFKFSMPQPDGKPLVFGTSFEAY